MRRSSSIRGGTRTPQVSCANGRQDRAAGQSLEQAFLKFRALQADRNRVIPLRPVDSRA
jgi:hypothetical protein